MRGVMAMTLRRELVTLVCAFVCAGIVCGQPDAPATPDETLARIERLRDEWRVEEAGALAEALTESHPDLARAWLWLGSWRSHQAQHEQALSAFDRAILLDPNLLQAHASRAWTIKNIEGGEAFEVAAREVCDLCADAIAADPNDPEPWRVRASMFAGLREYDVARADLRELLDVHPDDADTLSQLSGLQMREDPQEALQLAERAVALEPRNIGFVMGLGCALHYSDRPFEALEVYESIKEINPDAYPHHLVGSLYWQKLNQLPEAMEYFDAAIAAEPTISFGWTSKANLLRSGYDDPEGGLAVLEQAVEAGVREQYLLGTFAAMYRALERWEDAVEYYTQGLHFSPGDLAMHFRRAETLYELGRYEEAWRDVHRAEEIGATLGWSPDEEFLEKLREAMPEPERDAADVEAE